MRLLPRPHVLSMAAGAALAFLFDPDRGRARRARLRDKGRAVLRRGTRTLEARARDQRNRIKGRISQATHEPSPPADDVELAQRVRSEVLGRREFHDLGITVDAFGGVVHLRGAVDDPARAQQLVEAVQAVPGVLRVDSLLHDHQHPAPNKEAALRAV